MSRMPEAISKVITEHEDGYSITWDFGEKYGGGTDRVIIPPPNPEEAAKNRAVLNAILGRYGYRLKESGGGESA